jgi:hypothetical protein
MCLLLWSVLKILFDCFDLLGRKDSFACDAELRLLQVLNGKCVGDGVGFDPGDLRYFVQNELCFWHLSLLVLYLCEWVRFLGEEKEKSRGPERGGHGFPDH